MHDFVNPDLPKRVGIKKFSSAIKVGIYMEFALFIKRRLQEGTPCLLFNLRTVPTNKEVFLGGL